MLKKINFKISQARSQNDKIAIETELEIIDGVIGLNVDYQNESAFLEYDDSKIQLNHILETIGKLGYQTSIKSLPPTYLSDEAIYYVKGMHCASCEILIEKKLLKIDGVKSVEASTNKGEVVVEFQGQQPTINKLNKIFQPDGYTFYKQPVTESAGSSGKDIYKSFVIAGAIVIVFILLNKLGLSSLVNVNSRSFLPAFFLLGIMAGLSSCAALVGGLVLSMSKQWLGLYRSDDPTLKKLQPHLLFNGGRLVSYGLLGAVLGGIGSKIQVSFAFTSILVIFISVVMLLLGLQMLGVKSLRKFQITMPKFITRRVSDETKFQGRFMPFTMGTLTFFLPCGFTITAQGLALLSGNIIQGGLIMFLFALGTTPILLFIGISSVKFSSRPHLANRFLKVAGTLILFFALFNINSQLNVLGWPSLTDSFSRTNAKLNTNSIDSSNTNDKDLPPIVNGQQIIKMEASAYGYSPDYFKVRAGLPVRWEITDTGTSGCTNAVLSRSLFDGQIELTPGQTSIKEFTPQKPGKYKFSCWMGMISGVIEVVDAKKNNNSYSNNDSGGATAPIVPSGAKGCGCGGGGSGSCSQPQ